MRIGEVARRLGLPASTIRYYEKIGLIDRQSRVGGKRQFDDQAMLMLQFVQLAQAAGFTIAEMKDLLERHGTDAGRAGLGTPLVEAKRAAVRQQIGNLQRMDHILTTLLECKCSTLSECVRFANDTIQSAPDGQ